VIREARARGAVTLGAGLAAAACALGFFAATYPWVEGWYDLVRGDSLFLALGVAGLVALRAWANRPGTRLGGLWHPGIAVAAALLALSFHAKQTGVLLVAAGGATLLVLNRRAIATYVVVAGAIGGGGAAILNAITDGWYWIYVFRVHQNHDTNIDRFGKSFLNIATKFPALTIFVLATLVCVVVFTIARGRLPRGAGGFLYWAWVFACGCVIGALGWATQWAHYNAYIPAMTFGAITVGCAVIALVGCAEEVALERAPGVALRVGVALIPLAVLGVNLWQARWNTAPLIPTPRERAAGDALIDRLRRIDGDVYVPAHPWYAVLAGKRPFVHRMGILDLTYRPPRGADKDPLPPRAQTIEGLEASLRARRFGAVVMDDRCMPHEFPGLTRGYTMAEKIPRGLSPRVVSGARTHPVQIWLPKPAAPPGSAAPPGPPKPPLGPKPP
jgi:hypothetical protein